MRVYFNLSEKFHENIFEGGEKNISLPLKLPFDGISEELCYECRFTPPEETEQNLFFLEISALSGLCEIYCNGEKIISKKSIFSVYRCELTENIIQNRDNIIELKIRPLERPDGFFAFGDAKIIMTDKTHFSLLSDGDTGLNIRTLTENGAAHVYVNAQIENPNNYDVAVFTLTDSKGHTVEVRTEKPTSPKTEFYIELPELWDGPHSPAMYTLEAVIRRDSFDLDKTTALFGIRSYEISKEGFFCLNDIKNPLCGTALTDFDCLEDDFDAINELDANCIKITGLPVENDILSRCDDLGLILWLEIPTVGDDWELDEIISLAKMCSLHPSVAVISTNCREPGFAKKFCSSIKLNSQYILTALTSDILNNEGIIDAIPDISEIHIPSGTSPEDFVKIENRFSELAQFHPEFRFSVISDSPECIFDRHNGNARKSDCSQEYFSLWHERFWSTFGTRKSTVGIFTGPLSDRDEKNCRRGLITKDREEKKDAFWFYRAQFSATAFVRLCSAGQTGITSKYTDIKCYSNASPVKLTLNGKENKKYKCEKLSDCVYIFRNVKLKRKNNTIVVSAGGDTDSEVIFRSRSRLSKK